VAYRDDEDGLRLRVADLEQELAEARATIARLRGEGADAVPNDWGRHDWFTGGPTGLHLERELPFDVSEEGLEAIADVANQRLPGGSVSLVGRTLTHRRHQYELRITRDPPGRTTIRAVDHRPAARLLLGIAGMGASILGGGFLAGIAEALGLGGAVIAPLFFLGAVIGFSSLRQLMKHGNAKERAMVTGLFETVCDLAKEHRAAESSVEPPEARPRARVAIGDRAEAEALALEEAEAATEAASDAHASPSAS